MRTHSRTWCLFAILAAFFIPQMGISAEMLKREQITPEVAQTFFESIRETMEAHFAHRAPKLPPATARNGIHVVFIHQGKVLSQADAWHANLIGNLSGATHRAIDGKDPKILRKSTILLTVMLEPQTIDLTGTIPSKLNPPIGVVGFHATYGTKGTYMPPLHPYLMGMDWHKTLAALIHQVAPSTQGDSDAAKDAMRNVFVSGKLTLETIPGHTLALLPGETKPKVLHRLSTLVEPKAVTAETIKQSILFARQWYHANCRKDGLFPALYDPNTDKSIPPVSLYNQCLNAAILGSLWHFDNDKKTRALGLNALQSIVKASFLEDGQTGVGYIKEGDLISIGPSSAALLAILNLKAYETDPTMPNKAKRLVSFLKSMQHADGHFNEYFYPDSMTDRTGNFSGTSHLALLQWGVTHNDQELLRKCLESARYFREKFFSRIKTPPYTDLAWHGRANAALYEMEKREALADYVLQGTSLLLKECQAKPSETNSIPEDENGCIRLSGSNHLFDRTAFFVPVLIDAYKLAKKLGRNKEAEALRLGIARSVRAILQLQVRSEYDMILYPDPLKAFGGFRADISTPAIQLESTMFATKALVSVIEEMSAKEYLIESK